MVETVKNNVAIVLGREHPVEPSSLSVNDWVEIIAQAGKELGWEYLPNLDSLKQLLNVPANEDHSERICTSEILSTLSPPSGIKVFLACGALRPNFNHRPPYEMWEEISHGVRKGPPEEALILGRSRSECLRFFVLSSEWESHLCPGGLGFRDYTERYATSVSIRPIELQEVLEAQGENFAKMALRILRYFQQAQGAASYKLQERLSSSNKILARLEDYTLRLGLKAHHWP